MDEQRPTMNDQDWQRLREVLQDELAFTETCPPVAATRLEGLKAALQFMDAVEADAARVRGVEEAR